MRVFEQRHGSKKYTQGHLARAECLWGEHREKRLGGGLGGKWQAKEGEQ